MMSDTKALKAAEYLKRYCGERGCSECLFRSDCGFCLLQTVKNPEDYPIDHIMTERRDE